MSDSVLNTPMISAVGCVYLKSATTVEAYDSS